MIARYGLRYGLGDDPYCYAGTRVLKNRLHIADAQLLGKVEGEVAALRALTLTPQFERFDAARFRQIHAHLFQDVYAWAGEYRTVDIRKGDNLFCTVGRIDAELNRIFQRMSNEAGLPGRPLPDFVRCIADYYCEINVIHPFREGNGRAQRLLFDELIVHAGFDVDWALIEAEEWIAANIAGHAGDLEPLIELFRRVVSEPPPSGGAVSGSAACGT
ncbi:hypothetical protein A9404_11505 [Halothiobacillus diazotrophicus]|uniref:protein adenylyltransferase n=1 Tax=Halothiobacillus diazotrophicus TaxID=1860122 RepID=A0A191ZKP6_9GAMM|nr:hypothetical protein A9404_11505 [Halothiobacillus diazotrophicus]